MTWQNQIKIWLVIAAFLVVFLWLFRGILLPFIVGMTLAYLLDPLADWLEAQGLRRGWAALLILLLMLLVIFGALIVLVPLVVSQLAGLIRNIPDYVVELQQAANDFGPMLQQWLGINLGAEQLSPEGADLGQWVSQGGSFAGNVIGTIMASSLTLINVLGLLIVTPVVAFYLIVDWDNMVARADQLLPLERREELRSLFRDMDIALAGFVRGQGAVVLILAAFYSTALSLAGLNFGLAIGLAAGLFSFIPYVGFSIGAVLSIGIAIVQFWPDFLMIGVVVGIFAVGQVLEGNILYPKLVGESIGVHPVWMMFSIFAFALLFGFLGVLLAVPLAAIVGVLVKYSVAKYKTSPLYLGRAPAEPKFDVPPAA